MDTWALKFVCLLVQQLTVCCILAPVVSAAHALRASLQLWPPQPLPSCQRFFAWLRPALNLKLWQQQVSWPCHPPCVLDKRQLLSPSSRCSLPRSCHLQSADLLLSKAAAYVGCICFVQGAAWSCLSCKACFQLPAQPSLLLPANGDAYCKCPAHVEAQCCSSQVADDSRCSCRRCIHAPALDAASILRKPSCYVCTVPELLGRSTCLNNVTCPYLTVASEEVRAAGAALGERSQTPRRQMESGDGAMPRQRRTADTFRQDRFGGDRFGMQSRSAWRTCPDSISDVLA